MLVSLLSVYVAGKLFSDKAQLLFTDISTTSSLMYCSFEVWPLKPNNRQQNKRIHCYSQVSSTAIHIVTKVPGLHTLVSVCGQIQSATENISPV